jgi:cysteine desulfurase / selenocysteine lyase
MFLKWVAPKGALVSDGDFPLLSRRIDERRLVYLDSAATSLKPQVVLDAVLGFYRHSTANIHRGVHTLSRECSEAYEAARDTVARFINATSREIVFTANATESIYFVAEGLGLRPGDNVVTSILDHHSNILPWMKRCQTRFLPESDDGTIDVNQLENLVDENTRLVALAHASNVTGAIHSMAAAADIAHRHSVPILIDGSQSVPHLPTDVQELGCDFVAFSGHKMLGPSGIGVLFVRETMWERMSVVKLGGGTVDHVCQERFILKRFPNCFEAGTPNIEGALGLAAAIGYLEELGMHEVAAHDAHLAGVMHERFSQIPGLTLLGPRDPALKLAILSFAPSNSIIDIEMLGMMLSDSYKIMARTGTHCAHPYFEACGLRGSVRLSAYVYTTEADIHLAADATEELLRRLGGVDASPG